jgi:hypothetical protein
MNSGTRVALGVGAGYLLGRTRKMRLALMLAAAGANGKLGVTPGQLAQRGIKQLGSSPELAQIAETVRNDLLSATRSAAVTAASRRVDSWNRRLQSSAGGAADAADIVPGRSDDADGREATDQDAGDDEPRQKPAARRRRTASKSSPGTTRRRAARTSAGREDEEEPAASRRATSSRGSARASSQRAPVRRTRR